MFILFEKNSQSKNKNGIFNKLSDRCSSKQFKFVAGIAIILFAGIIALTISSNSKAFAVNFGLIPTDVQNSLYSYDNGCTSGGLTIYEANMSWLSPVGQPTNVDGNTSASPIIVNAGTSLGFNVNNFSFLCHTATGMDTQLTPGTAPADTCAFGIICAYTNTTDSTGFLARVPGAYLTQQANFLLQSPSTNVGSVNPGYTGGPNPQSIYFQLGTRYWFPQFCNGCAGAPPPVLTWNAPAGLSYTNPTPVQIKIPYVEANWFTEGQGQSTASDPWAFWGPFGPIYNVFQCTFGAAWTDQFNFDHLPGGDIEDPSPCPSASISFGFWVQAPTPPPHNISGTVKVDRGDGVLVGVQGVTLGTCNVGLSGTTDLTGTFNFNVPQDQGFCTFIISGVPANDTFQSLTPVGGLAYPRGGCSAASYQGQIANANPSTCNRAINSGYNFKYKQFANLSCAGLSGLPAQAAINTTYNFGAGVNVTNNPLYNPNITVTSAPAAGVTITPVGATPNPIPVGTYTKSYKFKATATGIYSITYNVTGSNINGVYTPCPAVTIVVGSTPYFNVQGGNVSTGSGGFSNNCTPISTAGILAFNQGSGAYTGSGTNLAALAPSVINGFASSNGQNAYKLGVPMPTGLSFANTVPGLPYGGNLGSQGPGDCSPDYYGTAAAETGHAPVTVASFTVGSTNTGCTPPTPPATVTYCSIAAPGGPGGFVNVDSTANFAGQEVLYVQGDVVILHSSVTLKKTGFTNVSSIPSFYLVVSGNITIDDGANKLDGVYVAEPNAANPLAGVITTCSNNDTAYKSSNLFTFCGGPPPVGAEQITIDGAVVARQVRLNRAYGDVTLANGAAETFTYNPNVWLVNPFTSGGVPSTNPSYVGISTLPPIL